MEIHSLERYVPCNFRHNLPLSGGCFLEEDVVTKQRTKIVRWLGNVTCSLRLRASYVFLSSPFLFVCFLSLHYWNWLITTYPMLTTCLALGWLGTTNALSLMINKRESPSILKDAYTSRNDRWLGDIMNIVGVYQFGNRTPSIPCVICIWEREGPLGTDMRKKGFTGEVGHEPGKERWRQDSYWGHPGVEQHFI